MTAFELLLVGGRLCLDFCNTLEYRHSDHPVDLLGAGRYRALVRWSAYVGAIDEAQAEALYRLHEEQPEITDSVFEQALELREAIYQLYTARLADEAPLSSALALLNRWNQAAMNARELQFNGSLAWGWRDAYAPEIMLYPITLSAVESLLEDDMTRIRQCPGCGWLFYDHSRNNSRTWCDMRYCGNRAKNKRFHQKRR
jgi:predicted RNA-binding Zn ribbon-like protein